ncbi:M48 family metallopeptidase [Kangiella sp. HZ709]|uniref:M48 family metallopeptidase n=1 Tax=Kangiella sp. HZ709 TaxID=2666328 RepID=UPI0012AFA4C4|nr:SprT family zinc-dependent metalloprotease [Kangiella sp. HZ709]MRX26624.1 DUF45 domain-containing protein [Kangiella sp. HZ709]
MIKAPFSESSDINFFITRSKRKTVAIHIDNNSVEIRAPHRTPMAFINDFVAEKRQWILNKLVEQEEKQAEVIKIQDGAIIPFMGYEITLELQSAKRNGSKLTGSNLLLKLSEQSQENTLKVMDRWLIKQANVEIPELVELFAKEMQLWDKVSAIKFRKTKTKWGHCTATGVLQFNPLILLAPEFVMNYLIVHELCHLVHQNHSSSFWHLVLHYDKHYQEAEKWLKHNGHKLWYY